MIPDGVNPACHRMPINVPAYSAAQKPSRKRKLDGDDSGKTRRQKKSKSAGWFHFQFPLVELSTVIRCQQCSCGQINASDEMCERMFFNILQVSFNASVAILSV